MAIQFTRILIVEDEGAHAEAIARSLETMEAIELRVVGSLRQFRDEAAAWNPELVLMDLNLPDGRATEVLADPTDTRSFPIIVMTSYGSEQVAVEALKTGAFDYLVKSPETFSTLSHTLERLLREWQLRAESKRMHLELKVSEANLQRQTDALRQSEAKNCAMIANITDVLAIIDSGGIVRYMSPNIEKWFGWKPTDLVGTETWKIIHAGDRARVQQVFTQLLSTPGATATDQCRYQCKNGSYKWMEFTAVNLVHDPDIAGVLLNYHDITKRRRAEEALRESEERYRLIFEHSPLGIISFDPQGRISACNDNFAQIIGSTNGRLLGLNMLELPDEKLVACLQKVLVGHSSVYEGLYSSKTSPKATPVRALFAPMDDGFGNVQGGVGIIEDTSERTRAEAALRESEAQNQALIAAIPDLIFINRRDGEFLNVHASNPSLLFAPPEAFLHRRPEEIVPTPLGAQFLNAYEQALASNSVQAIEYSLPLGTETCFFEARVAPCTQDTVITIVRDVTDRKQAEHEKARLQAQLLQSQKMESLGTLAGGVAHDMNNVLGAILGLASASLAAQPADSPTQQALETIIRAAERGGKMVKGLLSFARQSPAESRELDMNTLIHEEVCLLERTTLAKVRLEADFEAALRPIRGDANALSHALMNLCVNAVDAMPEHGTLTLRTRNIDSDWIEIVVEDTGTGMPQEVLEKAMDPFFTTKDPGKGTGLGLSMAFSTVKAHQGQMEIQSEPLKGTRVMMRFPAFEPVPPSQEPLSASLPGTSDLPLEVLVVDDDELIRSTMLAILEVLGHTPTIVSSGEEALAKLAAGFRPDVVILDLNMPGLGGAGTLPRLRALNPTVPVLLATGRVDEFASGLAGGHPQVTLLSKPFSINELQHHLAMLGQG